LISESLPSRVQHLWRLLGRRALHLAHHLEICEFLYTSAIIRSVLKLPSTIEFLKDLLGGDARI